MDKTLKHWLQVIGYIGICAMFSCIRQARAATYLECTSKDIKSCTNEVTKGDVIVALAKGSKAKFIKIDFVMFDTKKGTLKVEKAD